MKYLCLLIMSLCLFKDVYAQFDENKAKEDSIFIDEVENLIEPDKVLHAEPLYIA